ncbi:MAG TPA: NAD(P)H-quinone oxidoreductase [Gemmatimonadaceae bacterium]|nr:NAD(P)H-quinone oxidoreductase [Gemmatimonadaceae bacterium]
MRAAVITRPGGPEVLEIQSRPVPAPKAGEVLVRVHASALNRADLSQRTGHYPAPPGAPPDIPGMEFAGEVAAIGNDVTRWREGDRVFGIVGGGGNAEYLVADGESLTRVPAALSWIEAAAIPEAFITAHDALVTQATVRRGERVLIHAVGSGVGLAATQLAHALGAIAYGTARTADKVERAREYGLSDGVVVGEDVGVIPAAVERWTAGRGVDVTLDLVAGPYVAASIRASALHGRIMLIGTVAGREAAIPVGMVLGKRLVLRGTVLRARSVEEKRAVAAAFARDVIPLIEAGALRPTIDHVYGLDEIAAAHERLGSNRTFGKIVLRSDGA